MKRRDPPKAGLSVAGVETTTRPRPEDMTEPPRDRFTLIAGRAEGQAAAFARDVRQGLTASPKRLCCRYFYDHAGSLLFEEISRLPEYYLTRAEAEILHERAAEIAAGLPGQVTLFELGSGSAAKTRLLIEALLRRQGSLRYVPVDLARRMLEQSSRALVGEYPQLAITAVAGDFGDGLGQWKHLRAAEGPILALYLGSNVGNFDRPEAARFLASVRDEMTGDDRLLLGIDLRKDKALLESAYDDAQGVTARFNRNLLARINRELGGRFEPGSFDHRAVYDENLGRIEMYLASRMAERVRVDRLEQEFSFQPGETIHTENSYKYSLAEIDELAGQAGLRIADQWFDAAGLYSLNLVARDQTC